MTVSILPGHRASLSNSRTETLFLDDNTAVPATDVAFRGGCAFKGSTDELYVCAQPGGGSAPQTVYSRGGKRVRGDGALIIENGGTPVYNKHGVAQNATGNICANETAPARFPNDVGTSETGVAGLTNAN